MNGDSDGDRVLLIFDWFGGDDLELYLIENAPDWLAKCHHQYTNAVNPENVDELLRRVHDATCEQPDAFYNSDDPIAGEWVRHKLTLGCTKAVDLGPVKIVVTGWIP